MIKKALWALALLFIVSGCKDDNHDTPPRNERLVTTTFNFEYDFAYDDAPSSVLTEAPAMPADLNFRVIMELYEWVENQDAPGTYTYRFYERAIYSTDQHVLGDNGKLYMTGTLKVPKTKFTAVIWGDYSRASSPRSDYWYYTFRSDYYNEENRGLRRAFMNPNYEKGEGFDVALGGTYTFDFSYLEDVDNAFTSVSMSMDRVLGEFTLVANDLEEYKASCDPAMYETNFKPEVISVDFGTYSLETPLAGYRYSFDGLFQRVGSTTPSSKLIAYSPIENGTAKMTIANDFLFSDPNLDKQEMTVSIIGPMNVTLSKFKIQVPIKRNERTVIEAPFLTGKFDGTFANEFGVTIIDEFDGKIN